MYKNLKINGTKRKSNKNILLICSLKLLNDTYEAELIPHSLQYHKAKSGTYKFFSFESIENYYFIIIMGLMASTDILFSHCDIVLDLVATTRMELTDLGKHLGSICGASASNRDLVSKDVKKYGKSSKIFAFMLKKYNLIVTQLVNSKERNVF